MGLAIPALVLAGIAVAAQASPNIANVSICFFGMLPSGVESFICEVESSAAPFVFRSLDDA